MRPGPDEPYRLQASEIAQRDSPAAVMLLSVLIGFLHIYDAEWLWPHPLLLVQTHAIDPSACERHCKGFCRHLQQPHSVHQHCKVLPGSMQRESIVLSPFQRTHTRSFS